MYAGPRVMQGAMTDTHMDAAIGRVIDSAARLGVEIDADEARRWIDVDGRRGHRRRHRRRRRYGRVRSPRDDARPRSGRPGPLPAASPRSSASRTAPTSRPRWRCQGRQPRARSTLIRPMPTSSSASTSPPHARRGVPHPGRADARQGDGDDVRAHPSAVGGQAGHLGRRRDQGRQAGPQGQSRSRGRQPRSLRAR